MKKKTIIMILIAVVLGFGLYKTCLLLYYRDLNLYSTDYDKISPLVKGVVCDKKLSNVHIDDLHIYITTTLKEKNYKGSEIHSYVPQNESLKENSNTLTIASGLPCLEGYRKNDKRIETTNIDKLWKKNNISTDYDLLKYYYNERKNNTIFSSSNDIKMNFISDICLKESLGFYDGGEHYFLEGDIQGVYHIGSKDFSIVVYNPSNNKNYFIRIITRPRKSNYKEIFTEKEVDKIISSIYFD